MIKRIKRRIQAKKLKKETCPRMLHSWQPYTELLHHNQPLLSSPSPLQIFFSSSRYCRCCKPSEDQGRCSDPCGESWRGGFPSRGEQPQGLPLFSTDPPGYRLQEVVPPGCNHSHLSSSSSARPSPWWSRPRRRGRRGLRRWRRCCCIESLLLDHCHYPLSTTLHFYSKTQP